MREHRNLRTGGFVALLIGAAMIAAAPTTAHAWGTFNQTCNGQFFNGASYAPGGAFPTGHANSHIASGGACTQVRVRWLSGAGAGAWSYGSTVVGIGSAPTGAYGAGHGAFNPVTPPGGGWLNRNT